MGAPHTSWHGNNLMGSLMETNHTSREHIPRLMGTLHGVWEHLLGESHAYWKRPTPHGVTPRSVGEPHGTSHAAWKVSPTRIFLSGTRLTYMGSFGDIDFSLKARRLTWCGYSSGLRRLRGVSEVQEISAGTGSAYREESCSSP